MSQFTEDTIARWARPCLILLCGTMSLTLLAIYAIDQKFGNDFAVYWRTAVHDPMWAYSTMEKWPFPYAPTMLLWVKPLALLPLWPAYVLWVVLSIAALAKACRKHLSKTATALVLTSPPVVHGLFTGQVSAVLAAAMLWACGTGNRIAAGLVFGAIATIKPQLVIMAPLLFLVTRDWRAIAASGATFVAIIIATTLIFGAERWPEWIGSMGYFHWILVNFNFLAGGVSLAAAAEFYGLTPTPFLLVGLIVGAYLTYQCRNGSPLEKTAALAAGSLMAAPYALTYDLAPLVPFLVWSVLQGRIWPVISLMAQLNPLPLLIAAYELLRGKSLPRFGWPSRRPASAMAEEAV